MLFHRYCLLITLPLALWPISARAQAVPNQPVPRKGQVLDISGDPVLKSLPVSRLTVDIDKQPAQTAARAMSTGGLTLAINPGPYRNLDAQVVSVHLKDAPYMEGLMQVRQQLRARVSEVSGTQVTLQYFPTDEVAPWCVAGPFAVQLVSISNEVMVPYDVRSHLTGEPVHRAILRMDLLTEPGITLLQSMKDIKFSGLEDELHQGIGFSSAQPGGIQTVHPVTLQLTLPETPGRRIPLLKGTIDAMVGTTVAVEVPNATQKQTPPPVQGMTIEISPMEQRNGSTTFFTLKVQYARGTMAPEQWAQVAPRLTTTRPVMARGGRSGQISVTATPPSRNAPPPGETVVVNYNVTVGQGAAPPGKLTLFIPVGTTEVRVPFEFKDVPLP